MAGRDRPVRHRLAQGYEGVCLRVTEPIGQQALHVGDDLLGIPDRGAQQPLRRRGCRYPASPASRQQVLRSVWDNKPATKARAASRGSLPSILEHQQPPGRVYAVAHGQRTIFGFLTLSMIMQWPRPN
ncbi:hypothetical protein ACFYPX_14135 [Micromonospora zamorensis]|uniref:hypothetical protein n=1 Tax=Micromonospora zamorensis TaxID=709883 RepID=UPI0036AF214C